MKPATYAAWLPGAARGVLREYGARANSTRRTARSPELDDTDMAGVIDEVVLAHERLSSLRG